MRSTEPAPISPPVAPAKPKDSIESSAGGFFAQQIGGVRYVMFCLAVVAQLITIVITWQLWQIRIEPPNLPVMEVPKFSFGIILVATLGYCMIDPRRGCLVHAIALGTASFFDQFRLQPQFLAILILMFAAVSRHGAIICRWFMVSVWLWAGLHKFVSPDWFAHAGAWLVKQADMSVSSFHIPYAVSVAGTEVLLGILAIFWPRIAAWCCLLFHISVAMFLILIEWNYSVLPWNFATAIIGAWVLWNAGSKTRQKLAWENIAAAFFLIYPVGFYFGVVDHVYASVLYSDYVPRGLITRHDGSLLHVTGWKNVHVPFPYERRLHRQYFESVALPGEKLHIDDPRPWLDDQFFVAIENNRAREISDAEFFETGPGEVKGIGCDSRRSVFLLLRDGARMLKRSEKGMIYAIEFIPEHFDPQMLTLLIGFPNLEQVQLQDCNVSNEDLRHLSELKRLTGIGLQNTPVSDVGLRHLESLPRLEHIEFRNTSITREGIDRLLRKIRGQ